MRKFFSILFVLVLIAGLLYTGLLLFPSILFAHKVEYKHYSVYSDEKIDENIYFILDDATKRISKSELYDSTLHFSIFICNQLWKFKIFAQGNKYAGAITHYHLTGNIFFRPCDISNNEIIPPGGRKSAYHPFTFADRPLSYYFAHEMTHELEANYLGRLNFSIPTWLTEGYCDYIGKSGNFDFNENLKRLYQNAPDLDPKQGLYKYYHLLIAYLLDKKEMTIKQVYNLTPKETDIRSALLKASSIK